MKIALCISTRNRKEAFYKCHAEWFKFAPTDCEFKIIVVDDASSPRYVHEYDHYFPERAGIPRVKNKCLELAMEWGADFIVLADDDVYPIAHNWHLPYINSPYPHLCFSWPEKYQDQPSKLRWEEARHHFYHLGNGCLMTFTRTCIERVGGFRTEYGIGKYEHSDLSHRIAASGLQPHPFIDVIGSDKLFHSMDKAGEVARSFTDQEKAELLQRNYPIFASKRFDTNFVPYDDTRK